MAESYFEQSENEMKVINKVKQFLQEGCRCTKGAKNGPSSSYFSEQTVLSNLNNCFELTSTELDLVILANIQAFTRVDHFGDERNRSPCCNFHYQSFSICRDMFLHLYGISYSRFLLLKKHYENHGISQRTRGNHKRLPSNTLPQMVVEDVNMFLTNYVKENVTR